MSHARVGQKIELGVCIGWAMEETERFGRLVGIRNDHCSPIRKYIIREYKEGDGWFPTGGYRTTSELFLVPHRATDETCAEAPVVLRRTMR